MYKVLVIGLLVMSLFVTTACIGEGEADESQAQYDQLLAAHEKLQVEYDELQVGYDDLRVKHDQLSVRYEKLETEYSKLEEEKAELRTKLEGTLPYPKWPEGQVQLYNNFGQVHNPTRKELIAFLKEETVGIPNVAEKLHNRAEAKGIRAAFVVAWFGGSERFPEHSPITLNAFYLRHEERVIYVDWMPGDESLEVDLEVGKALTAKPIKHSTAYATYRSTVIYTPVSEIEVYW